MFVRDIMTQNVQCVPPRTTVQEAAAKMKSLNVGAIPICNEKDRLAGMVTDRDIVVRAVAEKRDPCETPVGDIMTTGIVYCFDDQDIHEAAELMEQKQVRRLVVLDRNKRLVGIVSLGDLAVRTHDLELSGEAIEAISEPAHA